MAKKKTKDTAPKAGFAAMSLTDEMLGALREAGYESPTEIQAGMIPQALEGYDVIGQAQTGTGKTAAFAIPIIEQMEERQKEEGPRALVLVPTRELAVQVREEITRLMHGRRLNCQALYGGKPIRDQINKLRRGSDVVVGTPGRVLDHIGRNTLIMRDIEFVVLDEADRMLDIGFRPDIEKILRRCPKDRQTFLLSATVPPPIQRLSRRYMYEPVALDFSPKDLSVATIEQFYFTVEHTRKFDLLVQLLKQEQPQQAIIFCRTKRRTDSIQERLAKQFKSCACIHGDMPQVKRDRVMERFRGGKLVYLVATDVVGRGIDVTGISHIINFDIPQFCDDYVHRVGRTGRMGREGVAFTFVTSEEGIQLTRIEMRINRQLKRAEIPGFESEQMDESPSELEEKGEEAQPTPPAFGRRRGARRHRRAL